MNLNRMWMSVGARTLCALVWMLTGCADDSSTTVAGSTRDVGTVDSTVDEESPDVSFPGLDVGGNQPAPKDGESTSKESDTADATGTADDADSEVAVTVPPLIISEIMLNPEVVGDEQGEWVEITNLGDEEVNLEGWLLRDSTAGGHLIESELSIAPGAALVLGSNGDESTNGGVPLDYVYPYKDFILANTADEVVLEWNGTIVDEVAYKGGEQGWPEGKGRSLSLKPENYGPSLNDTADAWCDAPLVMGGLEPSSPGQTNPSCDAVPESACDDGEDNDEDGAVDCDDPDCASSSDCSPFQPGTLIITEFMANPGGADSPGEWFEVLNLSEIDADLRGLTVGTGSSTGHLIAWDEPVVVASGERLVIAASQEALDDVGYVWGAGFGSLKNEAGAIELYLGAVLLDRVEWSAELGFKVESGVALSLSADQEDAAANDVAQAWCPAVDEMSNGDLGTPGAPNPVCPEPDPCGNGVLDEGEACDDGNIINGDGCETDCSVSPAICGDGVKEETEACDDGNADSGDGCSALCQLETPVVTGAVIVTEVMADPSEVADSDGEWFEIYNTTDEELSLNGWSLLDGEDIAHVIPLEPVVTIAAGDFLVLGRYEDSAINGGIDVDVAYGTSLTLKNSDNGSLALSWAGAEVDRVDYGALPKMSGASVQLDPESFDGEANDTPDNWCVSVAALGTSGSPGAENGSCVTPTGTCGDGEIQEWELCDDGNLESSDGCEANCTPTPIECGNGLTQEGEDCDDGNDIPGDGCEADCTFTPAVCGNEQLEDGEACDDGNDVSGDGCEVDCTLTPVQVGDVVITELMKNPVVSSDSKGEWLELQNVSSMTIYLEGWTLEDLGSDSHEIQDSIALAPGQIVVMGKSSEENGGVTLDYVYGSAFTLSNTSDEVVLKDPTGLLIDQVVYDSDSFPDESGQSMSLDPAATDHLANDSGLNWCNGIGSYGEGDKGSPGEVNPACSIPDTCGDEVCDSLAGEQCYNCSEDCGSCTSCDVNLGPGCADCPCEGCVCDIEPTCCSGMWTETCAALCATECGGDTCPLTGCNTLEIPGGGATCEACVCAMDSACCDVVWDAGCATMCAEDCGQDCGAEDGCAVSAFPGAPGAECESCVCSQQPSCCEGAWDESCVQLCDLCGGGCLSDGCAESELPGCNACECKNCVCAEDPGCCDVAWDADCVEQCAACGQDCGSSGCSPSALPGCDGCACEDTVCAQNPACCSDSWDFSCAVLCIESGQDCGSAGCEPLPTGGCDGCLCEDCVCDQDPSCCGPDGVWSATCAQLCMACGQPCPKDGCSISAFAGCDSCACEACVCAQDELCCSTVWDETCVSLCNGCGEGCGFACGNGIIEPGEECDAGELNNDATPDSCRTTCVAAGCGDNVVDSGETCDDGNQQGEDGCSAICQKEGTAALPGDLIITEIMFNPETLVDSQGEWFELWNGTDGVLFLDGLTISIGALGTFDVVSWQIPEGTFADPGQYLLIAAEQDPSLNGNMTPELVFGPGAQLPNLPPGGIRISSDDGGVIDEVIYTGTDFPLLGGVSLSLDANQLSSSANDDGQAWCLGTSIYGTTFNKGTPGEANPACPFCGDGVCDPDETCDFCDVDCGSCQTGCVPSAEPGCNGCACEAMVCDFLSGCCSDVWNADCVTTCEFLGGCE